MAAKDAEMERDLALEALEADDYEDVDSDDEEGSSQFLVRRGHKTLQGK